MSGLAQRAAMLKMPKADLNLRQVVADLCHRMDVQLQPQTRETSPNKGLRTGEHDLKVLRLKMYHLAGIFPNF